MKKALINVKIYDYFEYIDNGFVVFDETITKVGPMSSFVDDGYQLIDGAGQLLLPGLVCGHTHIYSLFARGLALPFNPKNFQDILDQLWWKIDRHIDREIIYHSGLIAGYEFIKNGVTRLIDHHASGKDIEGTLESLKQALIKVGIKASLCFEISDRFDVDAAIKENRKYITDNQDGEYPGLFGMHASMSLSDDTLVKVKQAVGTDPIHIHVAESEMDQQDCISKYGMRVIERLDKFGLISRDSILVHAIHINDNERDIIRKRKATIAVNISSNMNNAVGLPDIAIFMQEGIPVIVGNDGLSLGMMDEFVALYYAMHHRYGHPTAFGLDDLKKLICMTYDYASRLFKQKLGRIQSGFAADFMLFPYQAPTNINADNAFGHVFFGVFQHMNPKHVYASGKLLVKDYGLVDATSAKAYEQAREVADRLWTNIKQEK
jgi:cytosine/adenosine deaminase-related metal-dependent hydrolase